MDVKGKATRVASRRRDTGTVATTSASPVLAMSSTSSRGRSMMNGRISA